MKRIVLALCLLPLLSACEMTDQMAKSFKGTSDEEIAALPSCPETGMMPGADRIPVFYGANGKPAEGDVAVTGVLGKLSGGCSFDKPGEAEMEIAISFLAERGPKGVALREQPLPYFIAVLSPDETVLQRAAFSTTVDFDNAGRAFAKEEHDIRVPVPTREAAGAYKVVVGFQLTPEQLAFNRENGAKNAAQQ